MDTPSLAAIADFSPPLADVPEELNSASVVFHLLKTRSEWDVLAQLSSGACGCACAAAAWALV